MSLCQTLEQRVYHEITKEKIVRTFYPTCVLIMSKLMKNYPSYYAKSQNKNGKDSQDGYDGCC